MRILMLSWEYPPRIVGGISRVVYDLSHGIAKKGHEVHVITCWETGNREYEEAGNVFVHRVQTCGVNTVNFVDWVLQLNFAMVECAARLVNNLGCFNVVHAHDWLVAFCAKTIKGAYGIPIVSTIHATEHGRNWGIHNEIQRYINNVEQWFVDESDQVIVNSEYMKEEVKEIFSIKNESLSVIPNGIDVDKFKDAHKDIQFRRQYALDDEKIVFFVGRIVNEKGIHVLIDAVPKILEFHPKTKFVIVGKGPQLDYLRWRVSDLGVDEKVSFTGYVKDEELAKLYKCVDVAVFPSLYEPFGIVALEGMVAGLPVVVTDVGGLSDIVMHEVDGMKAYTDNPNSLADCIIELLLNEKKSHDIKRNALEKVERLYNWRKITELTIDVYLRLSDS